MISCGTLHVISNGVVLYDGFNPQYAGENMLNFRDIYGLRPVSTEMLHTMQGGWYTSYMYAQGTVQ